MQTQERINRDYGAGLSPSPTLVTPPDPMDRRDRYLFSAGETFDIRYRQHLSVSFIKQGYITRLIPFPYEHRDFDAKDLEAFDSVDRDHKMIDVEYPGGQTRDLLGAYKERGLVDIPELIDVSADQILAIEHLLLPPTEVYLFELEEWLRDVVPSQIAEAKLAEQTKTLARAVAVRMTNSVNIAIAYQKRIIGEREGEMFDRTLPNGRGQARISGIDEHYYYNLNLEMPRERKLEVGQGDGAVTKFLRKVMNQRDPEGESQDLRATREALEISRKETEELKAMLKQAMAAGQKPATANQQRTPPPVRPPAKTEDQK